MPLCAAVGHLRGQERTALTELRFYLELCGVDLPKADLSEEPLVAEVCRGPFRHRVPPAFCQLVDQVRLVAEVNVAVLHLYGPFRKDCATLHGDIR